MTSRRIPEFIWSHNDSGEAFLYSFDLAGRPLGRVEIPGIGAMDWEDITTGECPQGSCLDVGDIGDNNHGRPHVLIHRVREPSPRPRQPSLRKPG